MSLLECVISSDHALWSAIAINVSDRKEKPCWIRPDLISSCCESGNHLWYWIAAEFLNIRATYWKTEEMNYLEITLPNYSYVFNFEEEFEHHDTRIWMTKNWTNGFYFCGIYMILIFGGQHYMQSRPRFELRGVLSLWNTALAAFSIIGACRTAPEFFHVLKNYGLYHSVCIPR